MMTGAGANRLGLANSGEWREAPGVRTHPAESVRFSV
jgi:hypothetical protein